MSAIILPDTSYFIKKPNAVQGNNEKVRGKK